MSQFVKNDPRINREGRPTGSEVDKLKKPTKQQVKDKELLSALRKLKPHVAKSIVTAAKVLDDDKASNGDKLKAAQLIIDRYIKLNIDLYGDEVDTSEETDPVQTDKPAAVFSLTMVQKKED